MVSRESSLSSDFIVVYTTVPDLKVAREIADSLLDQKLAACVNLSPPSESVYVWEGKKERAEEVVLQIKTKSSCYEPLEKKLLELHPYDTPEILALPVVAGSKKYLTWLKETLS